MDELIFKSATMLVYIIVSVSFILVTRYLIPMLKQKIGNDKFAQIEAFTEKAVDTAEILFSEQGAGEQKKDYVNGLISDISEQIGYSLTDDQINILIESAVKAMNDYK